MKKHSLAKKLPVEINSVIDRCVSKHIADSFYDTLSTLKVIPGTRITQVLEAVYAQGKKDALDSMKQAFAETKRDLLDD